MSENDFRMEPVNSSQIAEVGYDIATKRLRIRFRDRFHKGNNVTVPGGTYEYEDVPPEVHAGLMAADADPDQSIGGHFHKVIKGSSYPARKLT